MEKETRPVKYRKAVILPKAKLFNRVNWLLKEKYNSKPSKKFYNDVERLKAGEPVDYVIGFTEFLGTKINLSRHPLIPRPETEFWAGKALSSVRARESQGIRCLDLFSGSGCVGVSILAKTSSLLCDIADRQKKCLEQARINCKLNRIDKKRYRIIKSDVFSNLKGNPALSRVEGYDYIFANPPYIPTTKKNKVGKSVLKFEPQIALFGGKDGLFYIRKFLKEAKNHLNTDGKIFMEFSPEQKKSVGDLAKKYGYKNYEFHKDQFGKWRWVEIT